MKCPLCHNSESAFFTVENRPVRDYAHCPTCDLIWMRPAQWLPRELEKARYDHHENEASEGYRQFLEPILMELRALQARRTDPLQILDYGCGPTAFFAKWLRAEGFDVSRYDLHYFTDQGSLQRPYDVIVSTEVWEHFHHPREEIEQLTRMLKPGGHFAIATAAPPALSRFHDWYYRRDLTHVVFYSAKTMAWICQEWGFRLIRATSPYWLMEKLTAK
jgi:2-polyprenyl-3-methyl-5-hydroxy-6-metoxy-1,4-benzoquinol methylase